MILLWETSRTSTLYTWICKKHRPVVRNLGHNDVVHVDYKKHDPIVRNLEDDEAKHVN